MQVIDEQQINEYYDALVRKDSSYLGMFWAAVTSTGIFCLPTCTARKPKKSNVLFYSSEREPMVYGFRPCKVCKPHQDIDVIPDYVSIALDAFLAEPGQKISDQDLRNLNLSPSRIRRWFLQTHGVSFQSFQRMTRIQYVYKQLQSGKSISDVGTSLGYESSSGFNDMVRKTSGFTPSELANKRLLHLKRIETPLGPMYVCASEKGICLLEFADRRGLEAELTNLRKRKEFVIAYGDNRHTNSIKKELTNYFEGSLSSFNTPVDWIGSEFQQSVWRQLIAIPLGKTTTYQNIAKSLNVKSARAIGRANGANQIAIIVPCHRVIGSNGQLTGYGGGLHRKKWLLDHEKNILSKSS